MSHIFDFVVRMRLLNDSEHCRTLSQCHLIGYFMRSEGISSTKVYLAYGYTQKRLDVALDDNCIRRISTWLTLRTSASALELESVSKISNQALRYESANKIG